MQLGGDSCPLLGVYRTTTSTRNGELMTSILYAIGFTLSFCLSLFFGFSDDTPILKQALMVFAGFCMGGMALCVIDEMR